MNRNFAVLGLREDATKEQVKQAYELRLQKYRSSDYDDDPDYVRKKTEELKAAYNAAYSQAGTERAQDDYDRSKYTRDDFDREKQYEPEEYKPREYKPEKYDHDKFERDRDRAARQGEEHRFKTPDLSKLRDKMDSLKSTVSENVGEFVDDIKREVQSNNTDAETPEQHDRPPVNIRRFDGNGNIIEPTPQPVTTPRLDDSGSGKVIETPKGADAPIYRDDNSSSVKGGSVAGMVIAILIGLVMMVFSMCDDGVDDYDDYDDYSDSGYSYEYTTAKDQRVFDSAMESNTLLAEQSYADYWESETDSSEVLHPEANRFAKNYFKMDSIEEVTQYLYDNYGEFGVEPTEPIETQVEEILNFYGFNTVSYQEGRISPYTGEPIGSIRQYLKYLNTYYNKNGIDDDEE